LANGGDHLAILPGAVRKYEAVPAALFAGGLAFELRLRIAGRSENSHALVHVGLPGLLVAVDLALQAAPSLAPSTRHRVEEIAPDPPAAMVRDKWHGGSALPTTPRTREIHRTGFWRVNRRGIALSSGRSRISE
jgi:hypothetical protein